MHRRRHGAFVRWLGRSVTTAGEHVRRRENPMSDKFRRAWAFALGAAMSTSFLAFGVELMRRW